MAKIPIGTSTNILSTDLHPDPWYSPNLPPSVQYEEYLIQGKMFVVTYNISELEFSNTIISPDSIKEILAQLIVKELMSSNCIEFTKMQDPLSLAHSFKARIFATPNDKIQILRTVAKKQQ